MKHQFFFNSLGIVVIVTYLSACSGLQPVRVATTDETTQESTTNQRAEIVEFAKKFEGADYQYAGRSPKGFDCSGFTHYVMGNFGIELTPVSRVQEQEGKVIELEAAKPGDLIFFRRTKSGDVFHVSLVVANGADGLWVIHSTTSRGVVIDNIYENSYWKSKFATARDVVAK